MTKQMVWHKTYAPGLEMTDIKGSPEDIAEVFRKEQLRVAEQFKVADPATIEFYAERYGYDGGVEMMVRWPREETDEEYAKRLKKEAAAEKRAAQKEAKERAKLAELKAKYEQ